MFGTHSLRRGSVTEQFRLGIPDQVIKTSGRWKSQAFERYIDQEMVSSFHIRAHSGGSEIKDLRIIGVVGGIGKLFIKITRQAQHANRSTKQARC